MEEVWLAGGQTWINLVNTAPIAGTGLRDAMADRESLRWWLEITGLGAPATVEDEDIEFAKRLRAAFSRVVDGSEIAAGDLEFFNSVLAHQHEWTELQRLGDRLSRVHRRENKTVEQALGPAVEAMAETLIHRDLSRLRQCAHPDCTLWFYDDSKNGARRWCTMSGCGNRAKAAAFQERKRAVKN